METREDHQLLVYDKPRGQLMSAGAFGLERPVRNSGLGCQRGGRCWVQMTFDINPLTCAQGQDQKSPGHHVPRYSNVQGVWLSSLPYDSYKVRTGTLVCFPFEIETCCHCQSCTELQVSVLWAQLVTLLAVSTTGWAVGDTLLGRYPGTSCT